MYIKCEYIIVLLFIFLDLEMLSQNFVLGYCRLRKMTSIIIFISWFRS